MKELIEVEEVYHELMDDNTLNPTMNDICVCPKCRNPTFYHTDYNRVFCSKCKREIRNGKEFKGGKILNTKPHDKECKCKNCITKYQRGKDNA